MKVWTSFIIFTPTWVICHFPFPNISSRRLRNTIFHWFWSDDLGEVAVDVNYLDVGNAKLKFQLFICWCSFQGLNHILSLHRLVYYATVPSNHVRNLPLFCSVNSTISLPWLCSHFILIDEMRWLLISFRGTIAVIYPGSTPNAIRAKYKVSSRLARMIPLVWLWKVRSESTQECVGCSCCRFR